MIHILAVSTKSRMQLAFEYEGPVPSATDRLLPEWGRHKGQMPPRCAGIRVLMNQSACPWQPIEALANPLREDMLKSMACLCHRTKSVNMNGIFQRGLMSGKMAGKTNVKFLASSG